MVRDRPGLRLGSPIEAGGIQAGDRFSHENNDPVHVPAVDREIPDRLPERDRGRFELRCESGGYDGEPVRGRPADDVRLSARADAAVRE